MNDNGRDGGVKKDTGAVAVDPFALLPAVTSA